MLNETTESRAAQALRCGKVSDAEGKSLAP